MHGLAALSPPRRAGGRLARARLRMQMNGPQRCASLDLVREREGGLTALIDLFAIADILFAAAPHVGKDP